MNKCPNIGDRVKTLPSYRFGELTGTVMAIYPTDYSEWDEATDEIIIGSVRPEREWHVGVKVDVLPANWSYPGTDRFAPQVFDLVQS